MGFKWPFLLKFTVHVWTHRFPRWLWKSQPGNPSCQKQYLRQEALPLERPVQELNHTNQPILFYFSNEKKKLGKEKRNRCYLSNKSISACVHALIFSTGGIQSLSSFPIAFWDLHYALSSASSPGICLSSLLLFPLSLHFAAEGSCWVLGGGRWPPVPASLFLRHLHGKAGFSLHWLSLSQVSALMSIPLVGFKMRWIGMTMSLSSCFCKAVSLVL